MTSFIGKGERTVVEILKLITRLDEIEGPLNYETPGIYTQVPIARVMKPSFYLELAGPQQKSSIDVVVLTPKGRIICFRVQGGVNKKNTVHGHTGLGKAKFDIIQKKYLEDSGCYVVDVNEYECQETFKERMNFMTFFEITDAMRRCFGAANIVELSDGR